MDGQSTVLEQFNLLKKSGALDDLSFLRRENRELDRLITDASVLMSLTSVDEMLEFVLSRLLDHFIPQFLAFMIHPPRGERLQQYCYRNLKLSDEEIPTRYYSLLKKRFDEHPYAISFGELECTLPSDTFGADFREFLPELLYPMRGIGGLYGIVVLGSKILGDSYTELERVYLDRMTRFLAIGIQNGLHHESSITDPKTGLFNHDYFARRLEDELARISRHGGKAGVLMLDVDHFKRFNDTHGHLAGDEALSSLASMLKHVTRSEDTVSRFGGEEFCVLVMECDERLLMEIAERIRRGAEAMTVSWPGESLTLTISIGARSIQAGDHANVKSVLEEVDRALYASKATGRNRSTLFRPGLLWRASTLRSPVNS